MTLVRTVVAALAAILIGLLGGQGPSAALFNTTSAASASYSDNSNHPLRVATEPTAQRGRLWRPTGSPGVAGCW